jgi:hypothetical protein
MESRIQVILEVNLLRHPIILLLSSILLVGCKIEAPETVQQTANQNLTDSVSPNCAESDTKFFNRAVWPTLSTICIACHQASNTNSNSPALTFPADASEAFTSIHDYIEHKGILFANKPSMNGVTHNGGKILSEGSTELKALAELVVRIEESSGSCSSENGQPKQDIGFSDVTNISIHRTVRKAAILFKGRMPTKAELSQAASSNAGFKTVLGNYLQGETFDEWLMNSANDHLLTRKYFTGQTEAQEALDGETYNYTGLHERTSAAFDAAESAETDCANTGGDIGEDAQQPECRKAWTLRSQANLIYQETQRAIAEEPLELIRHVVNNNLPYSEILTANYMMMNPFTYETLDGISWQDNYDEMNASDWRPGHIRRYKVSWSETLQTKTGKAYLPSAGILSSPVFLLRYPSTDTNRNRARARWTYYYFLGIDIERLAVRVNDPEELKNVSNPGAEGTSCYGCHQIMDPVAGAFQSWGNGSQFLVREGIDSLPPIYVDSHPDYLTGDQWYRGQLAPGFNGMAMPVISPFGMNSSHDDGLQWLAEQIVADDRFATGTVKFWFKGVFGRDPMLAPTETSDAGYSARLRAYQDEQSLIEQWAEKFRNNNLNLKSLLIDMIQSPLFRGELMTTTDTERLMALDELGIGRLLTPEQLQRKLTATTGASWRYEWQNESQLLNNYYMFYGGIDSDGITARPDTLNSLMYSVIERMANEMSCQIVAREFWPGMTKTLFTGVEIDTDPTTTEGETAIRQVIDNLLWRLWGISDATEQDALWQLYINLYQERINNPNLSNFLNANDDDDSLDEFCMFIDNDDQDGVDLSQNWDGIDWSDPNNIRAHIGSNYNPEQTLRPWVGVLNVMLSDIQFVTE